MTSPNNKKRKPKFRKNSPSLAERAARAHAVSTKKPKAWWQYLGSPIGWAYELFVRGGKKGIRFLMQSKKTAVAFSESERPLLEISSIIGGDGGASASASVQPKDSEFPFKDHEDGSVFVTQLQYYRQKVLRAGVQGYLSFVTVQFLISCIDSFVLYFFPVVGALQTATEAVLVAGAAEVLFNMLEGWLSYFGDDVEEDGKILKKISKEVVQGEYYLKTLTADPTSFAVGDLMARTNGILSLFTPTAGTPWPFWIIFSVNIALDYAQRLFKDDDDQNPGVTTRSYTRSAAANKAYRYLYVINMFLRDAAFVGYVFGTTQGAIHSANQNGDPAPGILGDSVGAILARLGITLGVSVISLTFAFNVFLLSKDRYGKPLSWAEKGLLITEFVTFLLTSFFLLDDFWAVNFPITVKDTFLFENFTSSRILSALQAGPAAWTHLMNIAKNLYLLRQEDAKLFDLQMEPKTFEADIEAAKKHDLPEKVQVKHVSMNELNANGLSREDFCAQLQAAQAEQQNKFQAFMSLNSRYGEREAEVFLGSVASASAAFEASGSQPAFTHTFTPGNIIETKIGALDGVPLLVVEGDGPLVQASSGCLGANASFDALVEQMRQKSVRVYYANGDIFYGQADFTEERICGCFMNHFYRLNGTDLQAVLLEKIFAKLMIEESDIPTFIFDINHDVEKRAYWRAAFFSSDGGLSPEKAKEMLNEVIDDEVTGRVSLLRDKLRAHPDYDGECTEENDRKNLINLAIQPPSACIVVVTFGNHDTGRCFSKAFDRHQEVLHAQSRGFFGKLGHLAAKPFKKAWETMRGWVPHFGRRGDEKIEEENHRVLKNTFKEHSPLLANIPHVDENGRKQQGTPQFYYLPSDPKGLYVVRIKHPDPVTGEIIITDTISFNSSSNATAEDIIKIANLIKLSAQEAHHIQIVSHHPELSVGRRATELDETHKYGVDDPIIPLGSMNVNTYRILREARNIIGELNWCKVKVKQRAHEHFCFANQGGTYRVGDIFTAFVSQDDIMGKQALDLLWSQLKNNSEAKQNFSERLKKYFNINFINFNVDSFSELSIVSENYAAVTHQLVSMMFSDKTWCYDYFVLFTQDAERFKVFKRFFVETCNKSSLHENHFIAEAREFVNYPERAHLLENVVYAEAMNDPDRPDFEITVAGGAPASKNNKILSPQMVLGITGKEANGTSYTIAESTTQMHHQVVLEKGNHVLEVVTRSETPVTSFYTEHTDGMTAKTISNAKATHLMQQLTLIARANAWSLFMPCFIGALLGKANYNEYQETKPEETMGSAVAVASNVSVPSVVEETQEQKRQKKARRNRAKNAKNRAKKRDKKFLVDAQSFWKENYAKAGRDLQQVQDVQTDWINVIKKYFLHPALSKTTEAPASNYYNIANQIAVFLGIWIDVLKISADSILSFEEKEAKLEAAYAKVGVNYRKEELFDLCDIGTLSYDQLCQKAKTMRVYDGEMLRVVLLVVANEFKMWRYDAQHKEIAEQITAYTLKDGVPAEFILAQLIHAYGSDNSCVNQILNTVALAILKENNDDRKHIKKIANISYLLNGDEILEEKFADIKSDLIVYLTSIYLDGAAANCSVLFSPHMETAMKEYRQDQRSTDKDFVTKLSTTKIFASSCAAEAETAQAFFSSELEQQDVPLGVR